MRLLLLLLAFLPALGFAERTAESDVAAARELFDSGRTQDLEFRRDALRRLKESMRRHESEIFETLASELGKSRFEALLSEIQFTYHEIDHAIKNLGRWAKPRAVSTPITHGLFTRSYTLASPLGPVLILGAWNYPFQLTLGPLVAAIAAGNTVVLKPSEVTPRSAALIERIVRDAFPERGLVVVRQGDGKVAADLVERPELKHIFFTGSRRVGKLVQAAAAQNGVEVTLELGGKSPLIVHRSANLRVAAERAVWGANLNAGQTCVRPDYLVVDEAIKDDFLAELRRAYAKRYGPRPQESDEISRIVNERSYDRLVAMLGEGTVLLGGRHDRNDPRGLYIEPTFLVDVKPDAKVMEEEVFGPITPIVTFDGTAEGAKRIVERNPDPLALYCFANDTAFWNEIRSRISFGGGVRNDVVLHIGNPELGFGGVGPSGIGRYHGQAGFDRLSNLKGIEEVCLTGFRGLANRIFGAVRNPTSSGLWARVRELIIRGL